MKNLKRVGVDVDGVLRDITPVIMDLYKKHHPDKITREVVDGWDFPNINLPLNVKLDFMFKRFPKEIFLYSPPLKNTLKEFKKLKHWADSNSVLLVCVTSQEDHLIGLTYFWLAMNNILFKEIHIAHDKHNVDIDYLIDDSPQNYQKWVDSGRDTEAFVLFDATYNQDISAKSRIKELSEFIEVFNKFEKKN